MERVGDEGAPVARARAEGLSRLAAVRDAAMAAERVGLDGAIEGAVDAESDILCG